jgi:hypothetical protein
MLDLLQACGLDIPLQHMHLFFSLHELRFDLFDLLLEGHDEEGLLLVPLGGLSNRRQLTVQLLVLLSLGNKLVLCVEVLDGTLLAGVLCLQDLDLGLKSYILLLALVVARL